jgi:DNA-binding transcriptional MerR regulator
VTGSGATAPGAASGLMSIGEVLAALRVEFPDVTISKLRFLEAEGLVEPQRTPAGYRKYTRGDVNRLRFVLSAQRDHYLPLRVIREQLAALDAGAASGAVARQAWQAGGSSAPATGGDVAGGARIAGLAQRRPPLVAVEDAEPTAADRPDDPERSRLSRSELLRRSGLTEAVLADLEQYGMIQAHGDRYDTDALAVARVVAQLAEYGLEPRHLRGYRAAADREVGLFAQLVAPLARQSSPAARTRAAEVVRELTALSQQLHAALVRIGLRETLGR